MGITRGKQNIHTHTCCFTPFFWWGGERCKNKFKQKTRLKAPPTCQLVIFRRLKEASKTCPNVSQNTSILHVFLFWGCIGMHLFPSWWIQIWSWRVIYVHKLNKGCGCVLLYLAIIAIMLFHTFSCALTLGSQQCTRKLHQKFLCLTFNTWWGKEETWETSPKKYQHSWSVWINKTTYSPNLLNQWIKQWMITQTHILPIGINFFSCILFVWFHTPPKKKTLYSSPFPASKVRFILFHPAKTEINCHLMHQDLRFLFLQQRPGVSVKMGDTVGCTHFPMFPKESKTGIVSPNNKDEQMNIKQKAIL